MPPPAIRKFSSALRAAGFLRRKPRSKTAAFSAKSDAEGGRTVLLSAAAGFTTTLPAATATGHRYRFLVGTTLTSASYVIKVADATDVMVGGILINDTGDTVAATADFFPTASTSDTITMTQSIGAGKKGDWVELEDMATDTWAVMGVFQGETDPATPFSATV